MSTPPSIRILVIKYGVFVTGIAAFLAAWGFSQNAERSYRSAFQDTQSVLELAGDLRAARQASGVTAGPISPEPSGLIQSALREASIPPTKLTNVTPDTASRAPGSTQPIRRTRLTLEGVSIEQATRFMAAIENLDPYATISSIDLSRPPGQSNWIADITTVRPISTEPVPSGPAADRVAMP